MEYLQDLVRGNPALELIAILVAAVLVALLVELTTTRVLMRLASKTRTDLDDVIIAAIRRPLFLSVFLVGAWFGLSRLDPSDAARFVTRAGLITLAVLLWSSAAMRVGKALLTHLAGSVGQGGVVQTRTLPLFEIVLKSLVLGGAAYGILLAWRVDVTAWLASAGILGIAIGFAAKDTLANLFSGIFILADAPYKLGDFIVLGSGERGRVTDIGVRSTRILTRDDIEIIMPNAAIANAKIINETGGPHEKERVRVSVGVAYGSDVDKVRAVLMDVAASSKYLIEDPEPRVRFRAFGESSIDFQLMGWIEEPVLRGRALDELNTEVYKRFAAEEILIPFPQRDVHIVTRAPVE